jgi:hypothetical protein
MFRAGILPLVSFVVCHSPYARLVHKAFARMALHDALRSSIGWVACLLTVFVSLND